MTGGFLSTCLPSITDTKHSPHIKPNQSNQKERLFKYWTLTRPFWSSSIEVTYLFFSRHINSSWISLRWKNSLLLWGRALQPYIMEVTSPQCGKEIIWMIWKANGIKRRSQRSKSGFMKFPNIFAIRREILFKCCSLRDERQTRRGLKLFLNLISNKIQGELYCFDLNSNAI